MDSVDTNDDGLFVLAATNHPWDVDTALRRPGRFDRMIFVGPPDAVARKSILAFHMRGRVTDRLDLGLVCLMNQIDVIRGPLRLQNGKQTARFRNLSSIAAAPL
jgi:SpoVK/Ycf46/Vps4 family AAA+-type ATPase